MASHSATTSKSNARSDPRATPRLKVKQEPSTPSVTVKHEATTHTTNGSHAFRQAKHLHRIRARTLSKPHHQPLQLHRHLTSQLVQHAAHHYTLSKYNTLTRALPIKDDTTTDVTTMADRAPITNLCVDPSEHRYLLSSAADGTIYINDVAVRNAYKGRGYKSHAICKFVARDQTTVTNPRNGARQRVSSVSAINALQWFPTDTGCFVSGSSNGMVRLWDTNQQQLLQAVQPLEMVNELSLTALNTNTIAAAGKSQSIRLIDIVSNTVVQSLTGHNGNVNTVQWSTTNQYVLASGSSDGTLRLWDLRKPNAHYQLFDLYNRYNTYLQAYSSHIDRALTLRNATSVAGRHGNSGTAAVHQVKFDATGTYVYSVGSDRVLRQWDVVSGNHTATEYTPALLTPQRQRRFAVCEMAMQRNSSKHRSISFIAIPNNRHVTLYDIGTGEHITDLVGHYDRINCVSYNPATMQLFSGADDHNILVWSGLEQRDVAAQSDKASKKRKAEAQLASNHSSASSYADLDAE